MIDGESASDILSDDAIVSRLKAADIVIARRTVAKYRESLRIPSRSSGGATSRAPCRRREAYADRRCRKQAAAWSSTMPVACIQA